MKVFQIIDGFCHWDASEVLRRAADAVGRFPESDLFVDAPDCVFEGWGFDSSLEGDARFIQPIPPEGWLYDEGTGTFYREDENPPSEAVKSPEQLASENAELKKMISELEVQLIETQLALCEIYENTISLTGG